MFVSGASSLDHELDVHFWASSLELWMFFVGKQPWLESCECSFLAPAALTVSWMFISGLAALSCGCSSGQAALAVELWMFVSGASSLDCRVVDGFRYVLHTSSMPHHPDDTML
jgi:hypothetical protein